ncbi:hypothetical protein D3C77_400110 [compost metagenome]
MDNPDREDRFFITSADLRSVGCRNAGRNTFKAIAEPSCTSINLYTVPCLPSCPNGTPEKEGCSANL